VGLEEGLGVECLSGSGAIASAYSKAFREGLTITLVSGRYIPPPPGFLSTRTQKPRRGAGPEGWGLAFDPRPRS